MLCCNAGTLMLDVMINGLVSSRAVLDFFLQPCCSSSLMWIWDSGYVLRCFYSGFYNFGVGSEHFAYVRWWLCLWRAWKWVTRWLIWQPKLKNSPWPVSEIIKCLPFHQGVLELFVSHCLIIGACCEHLRAKSVPFHISWSDVRAGCSSGFCYFSVKLRLPGSEISHKLKGSIVRCAALFTCKISHCFSNFPPFLLYWMLTMFSRFFFPDYCPDLFIYFSHEGPCLLHNSGQVLPVLVQLSKSSLPTR